MLLTLVCSGYLAGQPTTYTGIVVEEQSREPIPDATLLAVPGGSTSSSGLDGQFILTTNQTVKFIIVQAFGHASDTIYPRSEKLVIGLKGYDLQTVEVKSSRGGPAAIPGRVAPSLQQLRNVPSLLGEPDLIRALQTLPGIAGGVEGTTGLHVRGSSPDQTLLLLDEGTIYNPGHFFGFLSVFHPAAVGGLELYRGYIPPNYAGRLSSVLAVNTRAGRADTSRSELSFGLLNSAYLREGPLSKNRKWTYLVGARLAHSASLTLAASLFAKSGEESSSFLAGMVDTNLKLTHKGDDGSQFNVSFYSGKDLYRSTSDDGVNKGISQLSWGNRVLSSNYVRPLGGRFISRTNLVGTSYQNRYRLTAEFDDFSSSSTTEAKNNEWSLQQSLLYGLPQGEVKVGAKYTHREISPVTLVIDENQEVPSNRPEDVLFSSDRFDGYLSTVYRFGGFSLFAGLNFNLIRFSEAETFAGWEPRMAFTQKINKHLLLELAYSRTNQDIHFVTALGGDLPYDIWLPVTQTLQPASAQQISLGISGLRNDRGFEWSADVFAKKMNDLVTTTRSAFRLFGNDSNEWQDQLVGGGEGAAYGLELSASHQRPGAKFSVAYTYSRSLRNFSEIDNGTTFPYRFDRPHDLVVSSEIKLSDRWNLSSNFTLQSGTRFTAPAGYIFDISNRPQPVFTARNNARLPVYHRLDIMFSKNIRTKRNRKARLDLGLYNVYARANASVAATRQDFFQNSFNDPVSAQSTFLLRGVVFSIVPTINYTLYW